MASRLELQNELEELLGSKNVYYQPPESIVLKYPAIVYSKSQRDVRHANNSKYLQKTKYEIIVISRLPDDPVVEKILNKPYSSYDRHYNSDNLNHDVITLYY